ncbi:argA [Symbiodinium natans]|uniref:amino-acid N-acetyltransferase n=1 Tax=Symbiodinium natans TaxID=878477 RepID=A0A812UBF4_9DINO|nr:argA [Symbiodinium natans]
MAHRCGYRSALQAAFVEPEQLQQARLKLGQPTASIKSVLILRRIRSTAFSTSGFEKRHPSSACLWHRPGILLFTGDGSVPFDSDPFECQTDAALGPVMNATRKGLAVDDTTLRWCSGSIPTTWPNADAPVAAIRLFKAWDPSWQDDRELAWRNLKAFVEHTGARVLMGTSISCVPADDEQSWQWTKGLMQVLGPDRIMGLAIGNELELLFTKFSFSDTVDQACIDSMWERGGFWETFTRIVSEFDSLGFGRVPVTSVFGGLALAGNSTHPFFEQVGKARVNSFFENATAKFGDRYAFTWTTYPYFDPNERLDQGTVDECEFARNRSLCFDSSCDAPKSMAYMRRKMADLTGRSNSTFWIGETGWSSSGSVQSEMKYCKNWAAPESLEKYYDSFLRWDGSIPNQEPPDHVFYFTIRDSLNFGNAEQFGVIEQCHMAECKLRSPGFTATSATTTDADPGNESEAELTDLRTPEAARDARSSGRPETGGISVALTFGCHKRSSGKGRRFRSVLRSAQRELLETEIRAAMYLDPARLRVVSSKESGEREGALRGQWLSLFRASAPYVAMFQQSVMVFHIPGHVLQNTAELEGLMSDIALCALLGVRPVLVPSLTQRVLARLRHEAGTTVPEVSTALQELEAMCSIAASSLEDVIRFLKQEAGMLCAEVQDTCLRVAAKPTGNFMTRKSTSVFASSQLLSTAPRKASSGWEGSPLLGRVTEIDTDQIHRRLQEDDIVCVLPVGAGSGTGGQLRYVPSEELAAQVAKELKAAKLIFFTRGQKLLDTARGNVVPTMQLGEADRLLEYAKTSSTFMEKEESSEIIFYLELLLQALRSGTRRAHLIDPRRGALLQELYTTDGSGTMISLDLYDGIRLARSGDVSGILELIEPLVRRKLLRRRNTYEVERACNNQEMFVWKRDDKFVGCASLQQFNDAPGKAELGCFVISPLCRGKGHGAVLLSYIEQVARLLGVHQLFLLTTQTMQWFVERGFQSAPIEELPPGKREGYDLDRSSKVFIKNISDLPSELQQRFTFVEVDTLD